MPKAHTFTALGMPLAPRGPPLRPLVRFAATTGSLLSVLVPRSPLRRPLVRFAACVDPFLSVSVRQSLSRSLLVCFAASICPFLHVPTQRRPPWSSIVRFAASADPFQPVSEQRRVSQRLLVRFADPVRLLPCSRPSVSACPRSLRSEAHSRPLLSASLHPQVHFCLFPYSEAYPSVSPSASQIPCVSCSVPVRPSLFVPVPHVVKPTTALSCPLRCIRRSISACFRAAKPIPASPRPLRSFLLPVLPAIFTAKRTIESPELLRYYLDLLYKDLGDFL